MTNKMTTRPMKMTPTMMRAIPHSGNGSGADVDVIATAG